MAPAPVLAGIGGFKLPDGTMAVSAAVTLHQTLALDGTGALRRYVNLFHNQDDIRFLQQLATAVQDGDRISVVPAIAGG